MSIMSFMERACAQIAVYWGNPVPTASGGMTYNAPVEISCRWKDKEQVLGEVKGTQIISRSTVHLLQDVDVEGLLYLGTLDDLDSGQESDPMSIESGLCIIKRFEKTPRLHSTTDFVRKAFLTPWLS